MKQEQTIQLPARTNIPATSIYTEIHTKSGHLGQRDVLILMPGGPGNDHTVCDYAGHSFAECILPYVDVILFDPRGCGKSAKSPIEHCTMNEYINDVEAIREHYKIPPNRTVIFGVSYGAIAALGYGIKYASSLKKLALVCGAVTSGKFIDDAIQTLTKIGTPAQQEMGKAILTGHFNLPDNAVVGYYQTMGPLYSTTFDPTLPTPSISYNLELANFGFRTFLREFDYAPKLSQVKCQTLIIAGDQDWIANLKQAERVHQGIAGSQLLVYKNCGHMIWIDQWELFLQDVIQFIK
ncbi:MAG: alpha/beta hydrolase [Gammaproteobacteria bacterium]|nr:alpha/beta hydrolase [Gammaproteobacteria bacterium]